MTTRNAFIDTLRGASLLGILLSNLLIFQYGMWGMGNGDVSELNSLDAGAWYFTKLFIETSFIPIFTILFGYSFVKWTEAIKKRGQKVWPFVMRRLFGLMILGVIHSILLWEGDILQYYGLALMVLIFFWNRSAKLLYLLSICLFVATLLLSIGVSIEGTAISDEVQRFLEEEETVYKKGTYTETVKWRDNIDVPLLNDPNVTIMVVYLSPVSLLATLFFGMALSKSHVFHNMNKEKKYYRYISFLIPIGLLMKSLYLWSSWLLVQQMMGLGGGILLAIGYIGLFARLYERFESFPLFRYFESVGKLSLSHYLFQSVVMTTVFYGYGLGYFREMGPFYAIWLGLTLYIFQLVISPLYLKHFRRGLIERLLRMLTNWSIKNGISSKREHI